MDQQDLPVLPKTPDLPTLHALPPLPKLPSLDEMMKAPVTKQYEPATPPPKPTPPQEEAQHTDNFGWLTNLPKSLFDYTKSVVYDMPKAALEAGVKYIKDPEQYTKDLSLVFAKNNGLGGMFREQMVDYYAKDFWHNFNEDPAHFLGDLAAVASLGGGTLAKAGELGKLSSVARVGETIAKVGSYIDPVSALGKGAARAAAPIMESLGFGKYTQELNAIRAQLAAGQAIDMNGEVGKIVFGNLLPDENERLLRLIRFGERGEISAAEAGNDLVSRRFKVWKNVITGGDEPLFKDLHVLDDAEAKRAKAIKMSEFEESRGRQLTPEQAMVMMDSGTHNPTFMSSYRMKSQAQDIFEILNKAQYRGGFWSRFERIVGDTGLLEKDADAIMARQIAQKHDSLYKIKIARAVEARMEELGQRQFIHAGSNEMPRPGYAPLQGPFYEKYYTDLVKSGGATAEILKKFGGTPEALAMAKAASEASLDVAHSLGTTGDVYVPRHVAAWINRELAPISAVGRLYDTTLARFKGLATVFNPRFWGSVVFGNAVLGLVYGVSPDYARIAYQYRDFLPPELRAATRAEYFFAKKGVYSRVASNLGEFAQQLDNMYRLPMFAQEIANDTRARLKFAGGAFFASKDQVINAVKYYGQAPERLMNARLRIEQLKQDIAGGFREFKDLDKSQEVMGQAISRAASREGPRKSAPGYDFLGNRIVNEPVPIENITEGKAVGGKPGKLQGAEVNEQGGIVRPKEIHDTTYGSTQTGDKRVGPARQDPLPQEAVAMLTSMHENGWTAEEISEFMKGDTWRMMTQDMKTHHAVKISTSAGDMAKPVDVNIETGIQKHAFAEPSGKPVPSKPLNMELDELTGLQVQRQPELYGGHEPGMPLTPQQVRLAQAVDKYGNIEDVLKSKKEDVIHKLAEIGELQRKVPGLAEDAAVADHAIEVGNRFYGSYLRLSPFERKTLRRLLPFYTFNKAMTMLAFKFPFLYPKRAFLGAHLAQAWNDLMSDENSYLPARLRDYVPVMARPDGSVIAISAGLMNPLSSARVGDFAELPLPSVFNPLKSNPIIALALKMNGSIPEWSGKPLSPGEYATRLDNGTVVQWTGKGFRTVIAQPNVFKSLFDLFPQAQLIDRLVHPFAQSDRGWLFQPDPILGPDNKPRYPKELQDLILSNVIPTSTYNLDEVKAQEQGRMNAIMKSYIKDLRFATPVRRDQILEILRGWQTEKNRRWIQ